MGIVDILSVPETECGAMLYLWVVDSLLIGDAENVESLFHESRED